MRALKRTVALVLVAAMGLGLFPIQAFAHRMTERVCDSDGYCYRQSVAHRHNWDGTITVLDDTSYSSYSYYPSTTYYSSYGYSPYYYGSGYYDRPYYRRSGVGAAGVIGAAALGYSIGRHHRR